MDFDTLYERYKTDYLHWEGVVSLVVATDRHANEGGCLSDTVAYCKPTPLSRARQAFGDIQVGGTDTAWVIPDTLLSNIRTAEQELRQGDSLTDSDGVVYVVRDAKHMSWDTQWMVLANRKKR